MRMRSCFFALVLLCPLATTFVACDDTTDINPAPHDAGPSSDASDAGTSSETGSSSEAGSPSDAGSDGDAH